MKLVAFNSDAIRYAFVVGLLNLGTFQSHDCGCEYCTYDKLECPNCNEPVNKNELAECSEEYYQSGSVAACPECGKDALESRMERYNLIDERNKLEAELKNLQP